jgi:hypothetical protein
LQQQKKAASSYEDRRAKTNPAWISTNRKLKPCWKMGARKILLLNNIKSLMLHNQLAETSGVG